MNPNKVIATVTDEYYVTVILMKSSPQGLMMRHEVIMQILTFSCPFLKVDVHLPVCESTAIEGRFVLGCKLLRTW